MFRSFRSHSDVTNRMYSYSSDVTNRMYNSQYNVAGYDIIIRRISNVASGNFSTTIYVYTVLCSIVIPTFKLG